MLRFLVGLFAVIGVIVVVLLVAAGIAAYRIADAGPALPDAIVLEFDFDEPLVESVPEDPLAEALFGRRPTVRDVVDALDRAAIDPRVHGMVARIGGDGLGFAQVQELRQAVARFRDSGRFAFVHSDGFGEFGPGNRAYYLAAAFERIWLQPVGTVGLVGLAAEVPFAREALDEWDVRPQIGRRAEYKTALDSLTERGLTEPHREMLESLTGELTEQLVAGIAEGRDLAPGAVRAAMARAPLLDREAVEAGLVDRLGYHDELLAEAKARAGVSADTVDLLDYLDAAGPRHADGPVVALIHGTGTIRRGESGVDPLFGGTSMGADSVVEAFDEAIEDEEVRAILFRIDSGGGSAVASETIRRAVVRARAAGKPVVVSMGDAAASGGYWIAMNADRIVAQPGTLTGSIGVVAGKVVTAGLWEELGVYWEGVAQAPHARIFSSLAPYGPTEADRLGALLDSIYATFTGLVAEARGLPPAGVEEVAKGRVWTGSQALALGLVDELGGYATALAAVRDAADIPASESVRLAVYPRPRSTFEQALDFLSGRSEAGRATDGAVAAIERLRPVLRDLEPLAVAPAERVLTMPATGLLP